MDIRSFFAIATDGIVSNVSLSIQQAHVSQIAVATLLAIAIIFFGWSFVGPSIRLWRAINLFTIQLRQLKNQKTDPRTLAIADERLAHLWAEYCETLHLPQESLDPSTGIPQSGRYRATVPAEANFNSLSIFEGRINAEFFKNLPGLLTGLGIIGTFIGLITGLGAANKGDGDLNITLLIDSVREAFYVSAFAIILAMLVTFIEKWVVSSFHRRVEQLCQDIDTLYTTGVGEEYLSRLVNASEESAAQAKILKDALVGDLRRLLEEMTQKQIEASSYHQAASTRQLAEIIEQGIGQPLVQMAGHFGSGNQSLQDSVAALNEKFDRVAAGIERIGSNQGDQIADGISGSMATFAQRLDDMLGGQIGHARDLQSKTNDSLEKAILSIETMTAKISSAGAGAASAVAEQVRDAMAEMAERQRFMDQSMQSVAEDLRASVASAQSATSQNVAELVTFLTGQVSDVAQRLQSNSQEFTATQTSQISNLTEQTKACLADLTASVQTQTRSIEAATAAMKGAIADLGLAVSSNVSRMSEGADQIRAASEQFAVSGQAVKGALDNARGVANEFTQLASTLSSGARDASMIVADYRSAREAFASIVTGLTETIAGARRDASVTSQLIQSIEGAAQKLVTAQREADAYLARINEVIANSHQSFTEGMTRTLKQTNTDFHKHLGTAVSSVASTIEELEHVLSGVRQGSAEPTPAPN